MGALTTDLTAQFSVPGQQPNATLAKWRAKQPDWLDSSYKEINDSYNSVTWEMRHTQFLMKLVGGKFVGGSTVYRITALFDDDGFGGSRITVNGSADKRTRAAIKEAADSFVEGGLV